MSNAAVPTNITANGTDLSRSDFRILFRMTRGLNEVPEVRGQDVVVPGLGGRVARNRRLDRLILEAEGWVMGAGATEALALADFRASMETLKDVMNPSSDPYTLAVVDEAGVTHNITARPINIVWEDDDIPSYRAGTLQWESVDAADWGVPDGS